MRIYENLRVISYAPAYLADACGLFAKHGLEAEVIRSASTAETADGLLAGRVDVSWGGPMRVMLHHDRDPDCPLVCFCNTVGPEPFSLVGGRANERFAFADLLGRRLGVVSEVPTPWLTLQEDVRRSGIDPGDLTVGEPRSMAENATALAAGDLDVIQVMEPYVEMALRECGAHVWHPAATRGDVCFTSFYTTRKYLEENSESCAALGRAMAEALSLARSAPGPEIARHIGPYFPDLSLDLLAACVNRYQRTGIWPSSTELTPSAFTRLKGALLSGGFISTDVPFAHAVDNRFALPVTDPASEPARG